MATQQRWIPLESNPKVLNKYIANLGAEEKWQFVDIYGLDTELLQMVSRPVAAVMLLYPLTDKAKDESQKIGTLDTCAPDQLYFMRQSIGNACGTVALVHALANNEDKIAFADDKHFRKFLDESKALSPKERAEYLENDEDMGTAHEESASEGDTQAPSRDDSVKPHFITFVHVEGKLFELDGRKDGPVEHGKTTPDTLLEDAVNVVKMFMARDPDEINFTLMALSKAE